MLKDKKETHIFDLNSRLEVCRTFIRCADCSFAF